MHASEKAMERLSERMQTLNGLYMRGIVSGSLLRKQIKSILGSDDATAVFKELVEPNRKALKILYRLENPARWRELLAKSNEEREDVFFSEVETLLGEGCSCSNQIETMLELASLPFFSGFLSVGARGKKESAPVKRSRVSVLD